MENLNLLELTLVELIIKEHEHKYHNLLFHIPILKIKSRKFSGVGSYSNFFYKENIKFDNAINAVLTSNKSLILPNLENELSYELNITKGRIDYLEIVTNGNDKWSGRFDGFKLTFDI